MNAILVPTPGMAENAPSSGPASGIPVRAGEDQLLKDWKFWVLLALAVGTMTLLYLNVGLADQNRERLNEVAKRQAFINDTVRISNFSSQFIQSLAQLAARTGDADIRKVLADHGVTFSVEEDAPQAESGTEGGAAPEPESKAEEKP